MAEHGGTAGDPDSDLIEIGCFGDVLTVADPDCDDVASRINAMLFDFVYGTFSNCQVTTPTSTPTTTTTGTTTPTTTTTPTSTTPTTTQFGGFLECAAGFGDAQYTPLTSPGSESSSCEGQVATINEMLQTCDGFQGEFCARAFLCCERCAGEAVMSACILPAAPGDLLRWSRFCVPPTFQYLPLIPILCTI